MDFGKSFTYMFDDKEWLKKIAIGGLLNLVPIVNFIPAGYSLRVLKNVAERQEKLLPEWDDWGGDFVKGLMGSFLGPLIYSIPIIILNIISAILTAAVSGSSGDSSSGQGAMAICLTGISCLSAIWGIAVGVVLPAAIIKYVMEGEFSSFFKFGEIFRFISQNLGNYIIALLLTIAAAIVGSIAGSIACVVGLIFTTFWATLVASHLLGQVKAESMPAAPAAPTGTSYGELTTPPAAPEN